MVVLIVDLALFGEAHNKESVKINLIYNSYTSFVTVCKWKHSKYFCVNIKINYYPQSESLISIFYDGAIIL